MKIEVLIYSYSVVCISLIVFNCIAAVWGRLRGRVQHTNSDRMQTRILIQLQKLEQGQPLSAEHRRQMRLVLKRATVLQSLEGALDEIGREDPDAVQLYLQYLAPTLLELAQEYYRQDTIETTYYLHFMRKFAVARLCDRLQVIRRMEPMLTLPSVYCRENTLHIFYSLGDAEALVDALLIVDRQTLHHAKLIHDGLLQYAGDSEALLSALWARFPRFSSRMQATLINFMRMAGAHCEAEVFDVMMAPRQDSEVCFACMRYFGKVHYDPAYPALLHFLTDTRETRWEFAVVAAWALRNYKSERTVELLTEALHSGNWYVRSNAADSLEFLGLRYTDLVDVFEGNDRYAREILQYTLDRRLAQQSQMEEDVLNL